MSMLSDCALFCLKPSAALLYHIHSLGIPTWCLKWGLHTQIVFQTYCSQCSSEKHNSAYADEGPNFPWLRMLDTVACPPFKTSPPPVRYIKPYPAMLCNIYRISTTLQKLSFVKDEGAPLLPLLTKLVSKMLNPYQRFHHNIGRFL